MAGTSVDKVLLAGPISSGFDVEPFSSEKDSYSLFANPVAFFEESKSRIMLIYFSPHEKLLVSAGIEPGSSLETIFEANALPLS